MVATAGRRRWRSVLARAYRPVFALFVSRNSANQLGDRLGMRVVRDEGGSDGARSPVKRSSERLAPSVSPAHTLAGNRNQVASLCDATGTLWTRGRGRNRARKLRPGRKLGSWSRSDIRNRNQRDVHMRYLIFRPSGDAGCLRAPGDRRATTPPPGQSPAPHR